MDIKARLRRLWSDMNPSEPSVFYLVKLMAFMVGVMVFGLVVGGH